MRALLTVAILGGIPLNALAGALNIDCRRPFVFPNTAVNVVLLPYSYAGDLPQISETSRQLSLLTQIDTLFGIVKFGSVGAVQHVAVSTSPAAMAECAADVVINKLLGRVPGATAQVQAGQALVVLWGRFYEDRGDIYIQSYIRFLRRGVAEEGFTVTVDGQSFGGRVSASSFAFTPRLISREDLRRIADQFSSTVKLHVSPDANSRTLTMALGAGGPFKYWVDRVSGNWMHLSSSEPFPSGWVQADMTLDKWSLRQRLPELTFVEGVAGYLSTRVTTARHPTSLTERWSRATAALRRALDELGRAKNVSTSRTHLPEAVGRQLLGLLNLPPTATNSDAVATAFNGALERVPNDANARNLTTTARLYRALSSADPVSPEEYIQEYLAIAALEPRNRDVLGNLEGLLELMSRDAAAPKRFASSSMPAAEVQKRLAAVRAVRKSLGAPGPGL
jgi:hypothetical protein